jgi:hypothetical protein
MNHNRKNIAYKVAMQTLGINTGGLAHAAKELIQSGALKKGEFYTLSKSDKIALDKPIPQDSSFSLKPNGLWFAYQDHWLDFLSWEYTSGFSGRKYILEVVPADSCIILKNMEDVKNFNDEYEHLNPHGVSYIDWSKVASRYPGIIIGPYLKEARNTYSWYNAWDVISGCVWHPSGISSTSLEFVYSEYSKSFEKPEDAERLEKENRGKKVFEDLPF